MQFARNSSLVAVLAAGISLSALSVASADILNATTGRSYEALAEALSAAENGQTIEISGGPFAGNFTISKTITLRGLGDSRPVLDGEGHGTVLTIDAPGVVVENVAVARSGVDNDLFLNWGGAGVAVKADTTTLRNIDASRNGWGILVFGGAGLTVEKSTVEDNAREGIKIMGGRDHRIAGNAINRNSAGVLLDVLHEGQRSAIQTLGDPNSVVQIAREKETAPRSENIVISGNEVRGNAGFGIALTWHSNRNLVENNDVYLTGIERKPDPGQIESLENAVTAGLGGQSVAIVNREGIGAGIYIFCLSEENRVIANRSHENEGSGIVLQLANRNEVSANAVTKNRIGILLDSSNANMVGRNTLSENADYGIRIGGDNPLATGSADNLVTVNDMTANGVNAYDTSGRTVTAEDLAGVIDTLPYPDMVKQQLRKDPVARKQMLQAMLAQLKPTANRWDDGVHGNRHDDFDEATEGFRDDNADGISEAAHAIPGGTSVDRFPLDEATVGGQIAQ
ncbi:MAG: right-handed parallel beta-helix repeat-containing protein [Oricola sp.]